MDFRPPLPFVFITTQDSRVNISETTDNIIIEYNDRTDQYDKSHIRSILIDNCENCVININAKLNNIRILDSANCVICIGADIVRSVEVLFSSHIVIKEERRIPLIHIEDSLFITIANMSNTINSVYLTGSNHTIIFHIIQNHKSVYAISYDMVLTDTVIDLDASGVRRSKLFELQSPIADMRCVI